MPLQQAVVSREEGGGQKIGSAGGSDQPHQVFPQDLPVHRLFESEAARRPNAIALLFESKSVTYEELNRRSNQLAHHLIRQGVGPGKLVGICLERSIEMVVGVLGILKSGAAYVPLDPTYPRERLNFMVEDTQPTLVLTLGATASLFEKDVLTICLERSWSEIGANESSDPQVAIPPGSLAYILFTSGSTGLPKGVAMGHGPLMNLIWWQIRNSSAGVGEKTLQFASLCFDVSFQEIFSTLCSGGTLVLIPQALRQSPSELLRFLGKASIARIFVPFVVLQQLAEAAQIAGEVPGCLREIVTAGEALRINPDLKWFFQKLERACLINQYGPTECHVVTAYALPSTPDLWPALPPIGTPIANTQIHLLDGKVQPVAAGEAGEIYIGGACLAEGYFKRPELTAAKFVPDPFRGLEGARLYRTGDLGRRLPDGNIEFLGRLDHQVKIRGNRVELEEIEVVLRQHPGVIDSVVMARQDLPGGQGLVAYVTFRDAELRERDLRLFLKTKLASYMVPSFFVLLAQFPTTPNAKVDRQALQTMAVKPTPSADYMAPRTDLERRMVAVWERVFERSGIGVCDSFSDLGGHSLLAVRLMNEINRELGLCLEVVALLERPTIEEMALLVQSADSTPAKPRLARINKGGGAPIIFLNPPMELPLFADLLRGCSGGKGPFQNGREFLISEFPFSAAVLDAAARFELDRLPTLPQMARPHADLIAEQRISGPCMVAGYSYGGLLAFEVAHQLCRKGIDVERLLLFDTDRAMLLRERLWRGLGRHLRIAWRQGTPYLLEKIGFLLRTRRAELNLQQAGKERERTDWNAQVNDATWENVNRIWQAAIRSYRWRCLPCSAVLFKTEVSIYSVAQDYDGRLGWSGFFRGAVETRTIPGDHFSMWKQPYIQSLAEACGKALGKAEDKLPVATR